MTLRAAWIRTLLAAFGLATFAFSSAQAQDDTKKDQPDRWWMYVGTYTSGKKSKGIYLLEMNVRTGKLTPLGLAAEARDPSFVALHPSGRFLYAVNEISDFGSKNVGAVSAFAIDQKTGSLTLLNSQPSGGAGPCHLVVDKAGKTVLVANYGGGSVASLPIEEDGKLGPPASIIQHRGSGADPARQKGPHAHSINLDAANHFALAADLGLDRILIYRFDPAKSTLTPSEPAFARVAAGAGPRHFAFHPAGKLAYVINELQSTVTAFTYDPSKGALEEIQTITTLPEGFKGNNSTAEVVVHPSGKLLFGSNRGHNSIASFTIDPATGKLAATGHQTHQIKTPRNFYVEPTGKFLIVASQAGDSLVVFRIDPNTGKLEPTEHTANIPAPVCVRMMPIPGK